MTELEEKLEEKLKDQEKQWLEIDEKRRLGAARGDYTEAFKATERHMDASLRAFLDYFGQPAADDASRTEMIHSLRNILASRPPQLVEDAPISVLVKYVDDLEQELRDIEYFGQGYGALSGRPKPSDMRMDFAATIGSAVLNSFSHILPYIRGTKAHKREERLNRAAKLEYEGKRASLDFRKMYDRIVRALKGHEEDVSEFMSDVLRACRGQLRRKAWSQFEALPYEEDLERCGSLILNVVAKEPPEIQIEGFWFGIGNPIREGEPVSDLYFMGHDSYEPTDDWAGEMKYEPRDSWAHSEVLASIHKLAEESGLFNNADYPMELAYASFLARACVRRYREATGSDPVGLSAGFQDGDLIHFGRI